jgi:hypothetical protein
MQQGFVRAMSHSFREYKGMSKYGKRLIKSLREALAIARGEMKPAHVYTDADVAKIRAKFAAKNQKS